jgi:hypothetical protein
LVPTARHEGFATCGFQGKEIQMRAPREEASSDAPQAISPDARPPTHDGSESRRAVNQPYAAESEDYQADHIQKPEANDERKSKRSDRG